MNVGETVQLVEELSNGVERVTHTRVVSVSKTAVAVNFYGTVCLFDTRTGLAVGTSLAGCEFAARYRLARPKQKHLNGKAKVK